MISDHEILKDQDQTMIEQDGEMATLGRSSFIDYLGLKAAGHPSCKLAKYKIIQ